MNMKYTRGFTILEILIVIAILGIMIGIIVPSFSNFRNRQAVSNTTEDLVSFLNKARNNTLLSKNSNYYSIHLDTNHAVLFTGGVYDENDNTNEILDFDTLVSVPAGTVLINGGGSDISFDRLTGDTSDYGTIKVVLTEDVAINKTITINKLGIISAN